MPRAVVLGGTGLIGRAVARRLLAAGWTVRLTARDPTRSPADLAPHVVVADRADPTALGALLGVGADLLVDCLCYTAADARALLPLARHATSTVVLSSKAVYVDAAGRHVNSVDPPRFTGPVREDQPTMAPGHGDHRTREGYGANKVAAEHVLLDSGLPVTVLRPSKVHGEGARPPREWWVVKRLLDRRPVVLLARRGTGTDHTSAAVNVAALVQVAAEQPGRRVLNAADPDAPDGLGIVRHVAGRLEHSWREVLLGDHAPPDLGVHPWHRLPPVVLDTSAATALGYRPVGDHATTVGAAVDELVAGLGATDHPALDGAFDYAAEDAHVRGG